jgi:hypothetical protein
MSHYVAIYSDEREKNPRRINPAASFAHPGDTIIFANYMNVGIELRFKDWPFTSEPEDPAVLEPKSTREFTFDKEFSPFKVFPYTAKVVKTTEEAEGSRPILIIYP